MSKITDHIEKLECDINNKADKQAVEAIQAKLDKLEEPRTTQTTEKATKGAVAKMVRYELEEHEQIKARKLNIIVQNLPEYDPSKVSK